MSLKTSIKQTPALFKLIDQKHGWEKGTINLDIGAGKFFEASKYLEDRGVYNIKYDINLLTADTVLGILTKIEPTTATIANVLNVIPKRSDRIKLLEFVDKQIYLTSNNFIGISVYAGNGSKKRSGFQNNKPLSAYISEIEEVFGDHNIKKISSNSVLIKL